MTFFKSNLSNVITLFYFIVNGNFYLYFCIILFEIKLIKICNIFLIALKNYKNTFSNL